VIPGMRTSQFVGKRVAVIGMRQTGRATARVLRDLGADVVLSDSASAEVLGEEYSLASALGVTLLPSASPVMALEGAELVVPSPGVPKDSPVLQLALRMGLPIVSEIEIAYRIARSPILAVTGTNGKSTTAAWLARMLAESSRSVRLAGNISADELKCPLITAASECGEHDVLVAEISSFQLEWVERFRPRVGILTNIRVDHLDRHGSFEEYARCKAKLFAAQRPDDVAVINAANAPARQIGSHVRSRVVWFDGGLPLGDDRAFVRDGRLTVRYKGTDYLLVRPEEVSLPGRHNLENALAAAAAAVAFGADPDAICRALRTFEPLPHRCERVAEFGSVIFLNCSMTTNVDAAIHVLEAIGRPVILIAGGRPNVEDYRPLGNAIARYAHCAILLGEAAPIIQEAAERAGCTAIARARDMREAVALAVRAARPGDAVVLAPACKSLDMYRNFEERGQAFRDAVSEVLRTLAVERSTVR